MLLAPLRWLIGNLGTLLLAFALAVVVWISSVTSQDPNIVRERSVPLEIIDKDPNMILVGNLADRVVVTIRATQSVWDRIVDSENAVRAWVDLGGLGAGTYELPVRASINPVFDPARITAINPEMVTIILEPLASQQFPVRLELIGEPDTGFQRGVPARNPNFVTVSGRESLVSQVAEVRATVDVSDARDDIETRVDLVAYDANGDPVEDVNITPDEITARVPITLQEAFRTVVVRPVITGTLTTGYRINNISVFPPSVLVNSNDRQLLNELPGFVETRPLDISGAEDDIETFVELDLPEGISVVDDSSVLVQVSIAAIEGSLSLTLPVTPIGLVPGYAAEISPEDVDIILSGPVPELNRIESSDIRIVANVNGLEPGTHQVELSVEVASDRVQAESILPSSVEVTIGPAPTPTLTPTGGPTPTGTIQP